MIKNKIEKTIPRLRKLRYAFCLFIVFLILGHVSFVQAANVTINLVAVNGSEEKKEYPLKYYLPPEITPDDIVNTGDLKVGYDIDKGQYYVQGKVLLGPKESKTIKIEVHDVWRISKKEVDVLKKQIEDNVKFQEGTDYYETAKILGKNMIQKLDYILKQQENYSGDIARRIEEYKAHRNILNEIRKDAFSLQYFQSTNPPPQEKDTVTFMIEVSNPSKDEERVVKQKHYLPAEIRSEDILDAQGFDVRYDDKRKQVFLQKEETFKPGETKKYRIVLKDLWHIDKGKVKDLRARAERVFAELKGTDYENNAKFILSQIMSNLQKVEDSHATKDDMANYIGTYRVDTKRLKQSVKDIERLEKILAFVKAMKLKKLERSSVKNILQKLKSLRGIAAVSKAIFGKKPSINTTWRIIWGIMIFVAIFTSIHFFVWWKRSKVMGEEYGGEEIQEITEGQEQAVEESEEESS